MKESELRMLIRMATAALDSTGKSIAKHNIKLGLKRRDDTTWVYTRTKSTLTGDRRVKAEVERELRKWTRRLRWKEGKTAIMEHSTTCTASKSVIQMLNNTEPDMRMPAGGNRRLVQG